MQVNKNGFLNSDSSGDSSAMIDDHPSSTASPQRSSQSPASGSTTPTSGSLLNTAIVPNGADDGLMHTPSGRGASAPPTPSPQLVSGSAALASDEFVQVIAKIKKENKDATAASAALRQIAKLLQTASRNPSDKKSRALLTANIVIKKYVTGLAGGLELMKVAGFTEETVDKKAYLVAEEGTLREKQVLIDSIVNELSAGYPYSGPSVGSNAGASNSNTPMTDDHKAPAAPAAPKLCLAGCRFFGDPNKDGLCSVCYKKQSVLNLSGAKPAAVAAAKGDSEKKEGSTIGATLTSLSPSKKFHAAVVIAWAMKRWRRKIIRPPQTNKERCWKCTRKLGFGGYECRCGYTFCSLHRYAHEHDCHVDHARKYKEQLSRSNQKVAPSQQLGEL